MTQYPNLAAAIAQRNDYFACVMANRDVEEKPRMERQRIRNELRRLSFASFDAARNAYSTELLPDIIGGQWRRSERNWSLLKDSSQRCFDHGDVFRSRNGKGPNRWDICAVIAHPYARPEIEDITLPPEVGLWTRPNLSAWYPGHTWLVVAATGLRGRDPAQFGFEIVR
jgi:hypothetical protein